TPGQPSQLSGWIVVPRDVTPTIPPGPRLEAAPAATVDQRAQLVIRQGGRIQALGTRLQPIVFTCGSNAPQPGCWRGLVLNGAALLNNDGVTGNEVGCPTKQAPDGAGIYGGWLGGGKRGVVRVLRLACAGR